MMKKPIDTLCLIATAMLGLCQVSTAAKAVPEAPLTAQGETLLAAYTGTLEALRTEIAAAAPAIDAAKKSAFETAHAAVAAVPAPPNPNNLKMAPVRYFDSNPPYKDAQEKAMTAARGILTEVDTFLSGDKLDAQLAKCALIAHATPRGLAEFAQQGMDKEALVTALLSDDALIIQIMKMGGAYEGKYGRAMEVYTAIQKASVRAKEGFFQRWALAVSLEDPEREGTKTGLSADELGVGADDADGSTIKQGQTAAEVMVAMYLNYEQAYLEGKLDPAFDTFSDFEYRYVFPERSLEDAIWMRKMMRNYRPDHITNPDQKWRYVGIVKSDIPYTSNVKRPVRPDLGLTQMQDFFLEGGICGPRAFTGKLATAAFGIPTRGARQTGHAAMCRWTPEGWTTVLGAHWAFNSWRGRCGLDFVLETKARKVPAEYMKVLRAEWLGDAYGEDRVNTMSYGVGGGFWKALAFYKKLSIVADAEIAEVELTGSELAESNEPATEEKIAQIEIPEPDKTIVLGADGTITIPVAACSAPESTEKVRFMKSVDGGVQAHYNLAGNRPEMLRYTVEVPAAGNYNLTAKVVTVTLNGDFILRLNRRTMIDVKVPYTIGEWQDTEPVPVELKEGRNSLQFTVSSPNKGLTIKNFTLKPEGK